MALSRGLGKLVPQTSALFVCDVQERFRPMIHRMDAVIDTSRRMVRWEAVKIRGADIIGLPVICTEQYPKALGATCHELASVLPPSARTISKTLFSMVTPEVDDVLKAMPHVRQVLLLGIEAHVCVLQTTLDLLDKGYEVHLLVDGVSSQRAQDRAVGLQRLSQAGAFLSTSEMALFQLMRDAKHKDFKSISALVKEPRPEPIPLTSNL